jgi:hypothetical protein
MSGLNPKGDGAMTPFHLPRRQAMLAAAAAGLTLATGARAAAVTANGTVYEDTPTGRRPIPDIMVSNGEDVVRTDAAGHWSLPIAAGDSVFVIKPTGWTTPVDPVTQLAKFAYLYSPDGTPASLDPRFAGVAPTGPLPASIDFALRRQDEPTKFDALLITDPQPESIAELGYVRDDVVAQLGDIPAAFGIAHGDLMFDDLAHYDRYNRMIGTAGLPWHNCPGNHDMNLEAHDNELSRETFKRVYGARYHAFQYGGATFFVLDNVEYLGTDPAKALGYGKYQGHFGPRQIAFVRNVLAQVPSDSLVVISHHIPLHTLVSDDPAVKNIDTPELLAAVAGHPNCISFSGHTHTNEHWYLGPDGKPADTGHHHHVLSAVSGSWWSGPDDIRGIPVALATDGSPNGFHVLSVDGNKATTRLIPAHDPAQSQLRIVLDSQAHQDAPELLHELAPGALLTGPISVSAAKSTRVVVNFFDGGPRSTVEMALGGDEFAPMRRTQRIDPFVQEVYGRHAAVRKPWVKPELSSHVWQAGLPAGLGAGTHRLAVRARDEHGREHGAFMVLEVV